MSVDFTKPVATADRAQNLTDTKDTLVAVAKQLDDTTPTGVAAGMIRWSSANNKWQKYNGTSWVDLAATFSMNVSSLGGQAAANYLLAATAASTYLAKAGGTLTGFLTLHAAPTADMHAATKKYADDKVAALPVLASGTWTPTVSSTTNVSSSTPRLCKYIRVGSIVHVSGSITFTPSSDGIGVVMELSLPVATTFSTGFEAQGTVTNYVNDTLYGSGVIQADTSGTLLVNLPSTGTGTQTLYFSGAYAIA